VSIASLDRIYPYRFNKIHSATYPLIHLLRMRMLECTNWALLIVLTYSFHQHCLTSTTCRSPPIPHHLFRFCTIFLSLACPIAKWFGRTDDCSHSRKLSSGMNSKKHFPWPRSCSGLQILRFRGRDKPVGCCGTSHLEYNCYRTDSPPILIIAEEAGVSVWMHINGKPSSETSEWAEARPSCHIR